MDSFIVHADNMPAYKMPPNRYQTFQIISPRATHFRDATCREVNCVASQRGWRQRIDIKTVDGQKTAYWIRMHSARAYTVERTNTAGVLDFVFAPGQRCFTKHEVPLNRPEIFVTRHGNPFMPLQQTNPQRYRPDQWVEQFAELTDKLATTQKRG